jgi:hypothetical protein
MSLTSRKGLEETKHMEFVGEFRYFADAQKRIEIGYVGSLIENVTSTIFPIVNIYENFTDAYNCWVLRYIRVKSYFGCEFTLQRFGASDRT